MSIEFVLQLTLRTVHVLAVSQLVNQSQFGCQFPQQLIDQLRVDCRGGSFSSSHGHLHSSLYTLDQPWTSLFACGKSADHTFRFATALHRQDLFNLTNVVNVVSSHHLHDP
jgi:hypothetical protein